jgi:hypothetical protein
MRLVTSSTTISTLLLVLPAPVSGQNLFTQLLNSILSPIVDGVCDTTQTQLGLGDNVDCACDAELKGLFKGVEGAVSCTLPEPRCLLPPSLYCATGDIDINVSGGLFSNTAIAADIKGCFQVDSGLPFGIANINDICFTFVPKGLRLQSCTATIGDVQCDSCEICDSGVDFKFDCSNVDILPGSLRLPGPKISTCLGLSLIPTNSTSRL